VSTYLVTGAAGFIASAVCEQLAAAGHTVLGYDDLNDAYDVRLKEWRLQQLRRLPGFSFVRGDINDVSALRPLFERGIDGVYNLAARAGVRQSLLDPHVYVRTNVAGTVTLLECCREFGVKNFLLASTSSLYGARNPLPFREDADTNQPLSPYAASKKGAEAVCHSYHHLYGINVTIPRYFTVYGPAGRPDMSPFRFIQWIIEGRPVTVYGDGSQSRDFTFVDDIARGTVAGFGLPGFRIVNLGSDTPIVLREMIALVERLAGRKAELRYEPMHVADMPATWADIGRARAELSWQPMVPFEEGMTRCVEWYRKERAWAAEVMTGRA
jgi:UDP-glucuronate 4-epimerase